MQRCCLTFARGRSGATATSLAPSQGAWWSFADRQAPRHIVLSTVPAGHRRAPPEPRLRSRFVAAMGCQKRAVLAGGLGIWAELFPLTTRVRGDLSGTSSRTRTHRGQADAGAHIHSNPIHEGTNP